MIAHLKLQIEKMRREFFGTHSERTARLIEQMELQLEELETSAGEDDLAAEQAARQARHRASVNFIMIQTSAFMFLRMLRERVVEPGATALQAPRHLHLRSSLGVLTKRGLGTSRDKGHISYELLL